MIHWTDSQGSAKWLNCIYRLSLRQLSEYNKQREETQGWLPGETSSKFLWSLSSGISWKKKLLFPRNIWKHMVLSPRNVHWRHGVQSTHGGTITEAHGNWISDLSSLDFNCQSDNSLSGHIIIKYLVQLVLRVPSACTLKQN